MIYLVCFHCFNDLLIEQVAMYALHIYHSQFPRSRNIADCSYILLSKISQVLMQRQLPISKELLLLFPNPLQ